MPRATSVEARHIDGPKLAAWLRQRVSPEEITARPSLARRLLDWESGAVANGAADRWLTELGLHLSEVPADAYRTHPKACPESVRLEALRRYLGGDPVQKIADDLGVADFTIRRWRYAAGLPTRYEQRYSALRTQACNLMRAGLGNCEVGRRLGIDRDTARRWRYAAGIPYSRKEAA